MSIPAVKIFAFLELEQIARSLDGHYSICYRSIMRWSGFFIDTTGNRDGIQTNISTFGGAEMKAKNIFLPILVFSALLLLLVSPALVPAGEYKSLQGAGSADTVFDFRESDPASALAHLSLAHNVFRDQAIRDVSKDADFVVIFMGGSVKMLSSNRNAFTDDQRKTLERMDNVISKMIKDGITLEVCLFAVDSQGVDPESISPEIERVPNGWISSIGYQAKGYALVPVY
ncbi:MAG: DsrE family protein [Desulfobacteraceae bacterium]|nr:DsrE family protein [Desulfobacteraceae bacterium]